MMAGLPCHFLSDKHKLQVKKKKKIEGMVMLVWPCGHSGTAKVFCHPALQIRD